MEHVPERADGPAPWRIPGGTWRALLLALLLWQGWLTLGLFGPTPLATLLSDDPVVSGPHPQHLYLGTIGAQALVSRGRSTVYDPAFQVGYPKTPIFDGSRLAELFLVLGGGQYRPAAYKLGLFAVSLLVPILLTIAARGAGLDYPATALATFLGQLVWWGPLGRGALEAGDNEIYLAALAGLAHVGLLVAYHRTGGARAWAGLLLTGVLGWFLQPLMFPLALPLLLVYYLSVGARHDFLTWHAAFWAAEAGAVLVNLPWLNDWAAYWWLRAPLPTAAGLLPHRTFATVWNAPLWGGPADRVLAIALMIGAAGGVVVLNQTGQRATARLLGLGAGGALTLALLGISWEPLGLLGSATLLAPALWFAAPPAAHGWSWLVRTLWHCGVMGKVGAAALAGAPLLALGGSGACDYCLLDRCQAVRPLTIGLSPERRAIVDTLIQETGPEARILWEDRPAPRDASRWPALLPLLTGRHFIGGLDPDGFIEHSSICLKYQPLEGEGLAQYCRRYNVGWVVAWSPAVIKQFDGWDGAERGPTLQDEGEAGVLFRVKAPARSYAVRGTATLLHADTQHIVLGDVTPENGVVVLSLHYQAGMRAAPGRVQVEREPSGDYPIDFVRFKLARPAARVYLTWDH